MEIKFDAELKELIQKAYGIREDENTEYSHNKRYIKKLFDEAKTEESSHNALQTLNSHYSTRTEESTRNKISKETDKKLNDILMGDNYRNELRKLLKLKKADGAKKSPRLPVSFVSKYLYFKTDYNFPIYDSLAFNTFKKYFCDNLNTDNYFITVKEIHETYDVSYDHLDAFGWLCGKLQYQFDKDRNYLSLLAPRGNFEYFERELKNIANNTK